MQDAPVSRFHPIVQQRGCIEFADAAVHLKGQQMPAADCGIPTIHGLQMIGHRFFAEQDCRYSALRPYPAAEKPIQQAEDDHQKKRAAEKTAENRRPAYTTHLLVCRYMISIIRHVTDVKFCQQETPHILRIQTAAAQYAAPGAIKELTDMLCRITDMHNKEVINVSDGRRLGCVDDVEVDTHTAQLVSIVIHGRPKCMGLMGHDDDIIIGWREIEIIGEETILVNHCLPACETTRRKNGSILGGIFGG